MIETLFHIKWMVYLTEREQLVPFQRTVKWGRWQEALIGSRIKEEASRKGLGGWDHVLDLVWGEKAHSRLGTWGLAAWVDCSYRDRRSSEFRFAPMATRAVGDLSKLTQ